LISWSRRSRARATRQAEEEGKNRFDAAVQAARTRPRPILTTSFAFIFGVVPLAIATGAGAKMRQSLDTAVFFGMLGVTGFGLIFTPVFYVMVRGLFGKRKKLTIVSSPLSAKIAE
jgi:HAE1 family hydrophobic/amphiphilic exporter-1